MFRGLENGRLHEYFSVDVTDGRGSQECIVEYQRGIFCWATIQKSLVLLWLFRRTFFTNHILPCLGLPSNDCGFVKKRHNSCLCTRDTFLLHQLIHIGWELVKISSKLLQHANCIPRFFKNIFSFTILLSHDQAPLSI